MSAWASRMLVCAAAAACIWTGAAYAGGGHGGGWHGGGHVHGGVGIYVGPYWGFGWYGYPYGWGYPYYAGYPYPYDGYYVPDAAYPPADSGPYVEPSAQPAAPVYWYYCTAPAGYYPYVNHCSKSWIRVSPDDVPAAPNPAQRPAPSGNLG